MLFDEFDFQYEWVFELIKTPTYYFDKSSYLGLEKLYRTTLRIHAILGMK